MPTEHDQPASKPRVISKPVAAIKATQIPIPPDVQREIARGLELGTKAAESAQPAASEATGRELPDDSALCWQRKDGTTWTIVINGEFVVGWADDTPLSTRHRDSLPRGNWHPAPRVQDGEGEIARPQQMAGQSQADQ
jgi:hypothetical protein